MRLVSINHVKPGVRIAKSVYDASFSLLVNKDIKLSERLIEKLKACEVRHIYIEDEISKGIILESLIDESLKLTAAKEMKVIFEKQNARGDLEPISEETIGNLKDIVEGFIDEIYGSKIGKYYLTELMGAEMYTYNHSVEVTILSLLVGVSMGLTRDKLLKLGMGAMLSDVGKSRVDQKLLDKKGKLSQEEFEIIKKHVTYSYDMVKDKTSLSPISRQIILMHHEKLDGSGYPNGFIGDDIPLLARIVTSCDIFAAIITDRKYSNRISIDQALEIIRGASMRKLDQDVYHHLSSRISVYPQGTLVQLTSGELGIVVTRNDLSSDRPKVRIIGGEKNGHIIDLMEELTLFIEKTHSFLPEHTSSH